MPTSIDRRPALGWLLRVLAVAAALVVSARPGVAQDSTAARPPAEPVRVVVTIPPLLWPVRELLGSGEDEIKARVTLILRPGLSEHGFELTPSQVEDITRADVVVMAGHGLEPRVASLAALPPGGPSGGESSRESSKVVSFEGLVEALHASGDHSACGHDHDHGDEATEGDQHSDGPEGRASADPHMWLDPVLMRGFVGRVEAALAGAIERRVSDATERDRLLAGLKDRAARARAICDEVDREHTAALGPLKGRAIVTHHNAWAYLCARYGLKVAAVVRPIETVEPTPGDVMLAVKAIREQEAGAVFVEPQFPGGVAERIAKTAKVKLETLDPLGAGDWPATMRANLAALVRGLKPD
ncbi:MAG: metal ABC transporter substrate-binding protein [Phycisphaerales bacterium]